MFAYPFKLLILYASFYYIESSKPCSPSDYGMGSVVCVCNQTYCDDIDPIEKLSIGKAIYYESNKLGSRFEKHELSFSKEPEVKSTVSIALNPTNKFQKILGFGGAITDAAVINIFNLNSTALQDELISSYYSSQGIEYNIGRVPMASCDFSTRTYSYDDVENDFDLKHFELAEEDIKFKIPVIKKAQQMTKDLILFGSPWSSPAWMKTNERMNGKGVLKGEFGGKYYKTWANYFAKFLQAYESHNISYWGLTLQNEPMNCYIANFSFQCLGFEDSMQRDFIANLLGPTLMQAGYGPDKVKIMILDDQRFELPRWATTVFDNSVAEKYVAGIALHWYWNWLAPAKLLDITHNLYPDKFILSTEACVSGLQGVYRKAVLLGNWENGETYAKDIIETLQHWTVGWIDWNIALDLQGGPNWVDNFVDAPIIVNKDTQEFYKQPMFYAMGHFSKFIKPGSVRIDLHMTEYYYIKALATLSPDNQIVLVILNTGDEDVTISIQDPKQGYLNITSTKKSIQSFKWAA